MKYYKEVVDKEHKGFRFLVLGLKMGHRCGYVQIPKDHLLYEKSCHEQLPITFGEISGRAIGKRGIISLLGVSRLQKDDRISMDLLFDVHGGITFSGKIKGFRGYWIGFDCAHLGDSKDISLMSKRYKKLFKDYPDFDGVVRTTEYVEQECKNLIDQIIKIFK